MNEKEVYLGDGLYASIELGVIKLRAPGWKEEDNQVVYLEKETFVALLRYANSVMKWRVAVDKDNP